MKTPCQTESVPAFLPLCLVTSWNWNPLENSFRGKTGKEFIKWNHSKYISFSGKFRVAEWGVKDEVEKVTSAFSTFLPDTGDCIILMAYLCYWESQLRSLHFNLGNRHWQCQQHWLKKSMKTGTCGGLGRRKHHKTQRFRWGVSKQNCQTSKLCLMAPSLCNPRPLGIAKDLLRVSISQL